MKKKLAPLFALVAGCAAAGVQPNLEAQTGGTLCQGSWAWAEKNVCARGTASGQCIRAVDGPYVLLAIRTNEECLHSIRASVSDTYADPQESARPRWEATDNVQNVSVVIRAGESLYFGTDGFNDKVDGRCYVTWFGHKQ